MLAETEEAENKEEGIQYKKKKENFTLDVITLNKKIQKKQLFNSAIPSFFNIEI